LCLKRLRHTNFSSMLAKEDANEKSRRNKPRLQNCANLDRCALVAKVFIGLLAVGKGMMIGFGSLPAIHQHSIMQKMFPICGQQQTARCNPFYSQAGQDRHVFQRFFSQAPAGKSGVFVEFGARNGLKHSNTAFFELSLGWKGERSSTIRIRMMCLCMRESAHCMHAFLQTSNDE
jgi:hypothetical protein